MSKTILFDSFKRRNFRFFIASESLTRIGDQIETVVLAWVVLVETGQPALLGVFAALRFLGTLIAPVFGELVDRYDRRMLMISGRLVSASIAAIILLIAFSGELEVWHLFILSTISGFARTFSNVMREVLTADVVESRLFANAIGLTRSATDVMHMTGPLIGGLLLKWYGVGPAYIPVVFVYLASAFAGYKLLLPKRDQEAIGKSMWENILEAGSYIKRHEVVLALLFMAFLTNLTALSVKDVLLPVFARLVLDIGPDGLGRLVSSLFAGAFVGSLGLAGLTRLQRGGSFLIFSSLCWHGIFIVFAYSSWVNVSMATLFIVGIFQSFTMVTMATLLIRVTSQEMRGRVMGVRSLAVYGLPMGLLIAGAISGTLGAPSAMLFNAVVGLLVTLVIAMWLRKLWYAN